MNNNNLYDNKKGIFELNSIDLSMNKTYMGDPVTLKGEVLKTITPLSIQGMVNAAKNDIDTKLNVQFTRWMCVTTQHLAMRPQTLYNNMAPRI